jgi:NADPH2:quinone reductase
MRAWQVHAKGEPKDVLALDDVPSPQPGVGEALVDVHATSLNFPDLLLCRGEYQESPPLPFTPGIEIAGRVRTVVGDDRSLEGKRVIGFPVLPHGGLAEQVVVPVGELHVVPEEMSATVAAALPIAYQTGWVGLYRRGALAAGETLLVHGGAGGVGSAAIQLGVARGARVIATARGADRVEVCRSLGAEIAIDYETEDFVDIVRASTDGVGADVVYDPVGGDVFDRTRRCIAFEGRLLIIGFASGRIPSIAVNHLLLRNFSIVGVYWGLYRTKKPEVIVEAHADLLELYAQAKIDPLIQEVVAFESAVDGVAALASRGVQGKIVVQVAADGG